jgi:ferredoxin
MMRRKVVLHFPHDQVDKPIVSRLVKDFDMDFNILKAQITPREEGLLVLELIGEEENFNRSISYLEEQQLTIEPLSQDIKRNEERCTHCGACTGICPSQALTIDRSSMEVLFVEEDCVACELCVRICPPRAMEVHY